MPAAAVIPAPIAYIKVVAVKKLVVELLSVCQPYKDLTRRASPIDGLLYLSVHITWTGFYFEKIRVFQAGDLLEYISME